MSKSTLGRGLSSLIPSRSDDQDKSVSGSTPQDRIHEIGVERIQPNSHQPRQNFDRESLDGLIDSIKVHGIIQPLIVLETRGEYQLIAGERRLRAAKLLGLKKVPVIVRSATNLEKLELAIVENIQRQNLNPMERARAYQRLIDEFNLTQEEVAQKVGQSRAAVTNTLRLLHLPPEMQAAIYDGKITEGHAKVLLGVASDEERVRIFKEILKNNLSVRLTEAQAKKVSVKKHLRLLRKDANLREKEEQLQEALGTKVEIKKSGQQGAILVHFYSGEELLEIIRKIIK
jgi:ParB family transcriptional regulator, chromosome partitioning protein